MHDSELEARQKQDFEELNMQIEDMSQIDLKSEVGSDDTILVFLKTVDFSNKSLQFVKHMHLRKQDKFDAKNLCSGKF